MKIIYHVDVKMTNQSVTLMQLKSSSPGGMGMSFKKPTPPPKSVHLDSEEVVELPEPLPSAMVLSIPNGLVLQYCPQQSESGD